MYPILASSLFLGALTPATAFDPSSRDLLRQKYNQGGICSTANVRLTYFEDDRLIVVLSLDPSWAESLAVSPASVRERWFAIHCPQPADPVWQYFADGDDIRIQGDLPGHGTYSLSCASYRNELLGATTSIRDKTSKSLNMILRRLGIRKD